MHGARWRRSVVSGVLLAASVLSAACRTPSSGAGTSSPRVAADVVRMLLVNDVYVTDTRRDGRGGLARVAGRRDSIERASRDHVLFVLAGDVLSLSVLGKWYDGAQIVDGFNAARLDFATLGDHEFDGSRSNLVARIDSMSRRESPFGNMIADVFLFADEMRVVTFRLSGARLRELLEIRVGRDGLGNGPYRQLSGVRFRFDATLPSGARVVGALTRDDERPIDAGDSLLVSIVTYPACRSGDGYRIPEAAAACTALDANPGSRPRTADLVLRRLERMHG